MEALATEVKTKVLPTVEQAEAMLTEIRPKLQVIADNLQDSPPRCCATRCSAWTQP